MLTARDELNCAREFCNGEDGTHDVHDEQRSLGRTKERKEVLANSLNALKDLAVDCSVHTHYVNTASDVPHE
jgi:hypothetical protein